MLNKSNRNKIKIRSTKKNYKYGGQGKNYTAADYPTVNETQIVDIGFEIPKEPGFNKGMDNYKFLEMADRDLFGDMEAKLSKYELNGVTNQYCKYMYLIRAVHPVSGNTVLHYICNHKSVEMFQLVWPYYLVLYNKEFPELLAYYINKKNYPRSGSKTPLDLLKESKGKVSSSNLDYNSSITGVFGRAKNLAKKTISIKGLADVALKRLENNGITSSRSDFIRIVLETYLKATGEKFEENKPTGINREDKIFETKYNEENNEEKGKGKKNKSTSRSTPVSASASASANSGVVTVAPRRPSVSTPAPAPAPASRRSSLLITNGQ